MTNFRQFDEAKNNMLGDSFYQNSSFRLRGGQVKGLLSSSAFNKLMYQVSTMTTAIATMMETKDPSYIMEDDSLSTLTTNLANIMTVKDMGIYALGTDLANYISKSAVIIVTNSDYTILSSDCYKTIQLINATETKYFAPPIPATNQMWVKLKNACTDVNGKIQIMEDVDGETVILTPNEEIVIYYDGSAWRGKKIADSATSAVPVLTLPNEKLFINADASGAEWSKGISMQLFTRSNSADTADIAYTGVGFKPSAVICVTLSALSVYGVTVLGVGMSDFLQQGCYNMATLSSDEEIPGGSFSSTKIVGLDDAYNWYPSGVLLSADDDGCTIRWTKRRAGTINGALLFFR
jgi:hypothetical protein